MTISTTINTKHSNKHNNKATEPNSTQASTSKCTYLDCLAGKAPVPRTVNGSTIFQTLMVGGMVTCMVTFNGIHHSGPSFFITSHWLYPMVFCIAFLVRTFCGGKIFNWFAPRFLFPKFKGVALNLAITVTNILIMAPLMALIITLLLQGVDGYWEALFNAFGISMVVAFFINYFLVGPIVKLLYNNVIMPSAGLQLLNFVNKYIEPAARLWQS